MRQFSQKKTSKFWYVTVFFHPDFQNVRLHHAFQTTAQQSRYLTARSIAEAKHLFSPSSLFNFYKINSKACVVEYWLIASEHQSSAQSTSSMTMWTWKLFILINFRFLSIIKVDESVILFVAASRSLWTLMNWTWWRSLSRYLFIRAPARNSFAQQTKSFCWCGKIDFSSFFTWTELKE